MHNSKPASNRSIFDVGRRHWGGIASFSIFVLLVLGGGCSKPTGPDQCKGTEQTPIEPWFRFHIVITRMSGEPHLGQVNVPERETLL
jgi:hypothetical protein